ncbi:MAG: hypothetical protein R8M38_04805 [Mariprofundaceae bacterium]
MARNMAGKASRKELFSTLAWSSTMLVVLIGGHLIIAWLIYANMVDEPGMEAIIELTSLPKWALWIVAIAAPIADVWIWNHGRMERKRNLAR